MDGGNARSCGPGGWNEKCCVGKPKLRAAFSPVTDNTRLWCVVDRGSLKALLDGSVFVVGGITCCPYHWFNRAESFDPVTQTWTSTSTKTTSANGPAVLLPNSEVLVAGGTKGTQPTSVNVASAELFDSSTGTWTATGSMSTDS